MARCLLELLGRMALRAAFNVCLVSQTGAARRLQAPQANAVRTAAAKRRTREHANNILKHMTYFHQCCSSWTQSTREGPFCSKHSTF
jgi:hypothetical protein